MSFVHYYNRAIPFDFTQASIYLDACFILAYFDASDRRASMVEHLIDQWSFGGVRKLGVSNHVFEEVVFNLFKDEIHTALQLAYMKSQPHLRKQLSEQQVARLGNEDVAKQLLELAGVDVVKRRLSDKRYQINVRELIKRAKTEVSPRFALHEYYIRALARYNDFIRSLHLDFEIEVENLMSETPEQMAAQSFIRLYQLEPVDAMHLAIAREHGYDYLLTLDHDYVHNFYDSEMGNTKILQIA